MNLNELIINSSREAIKKQDNRGLMPSGHNGPYYDEETPVRNTAHWCITFLKAYELSSKDQYLEAGLKCGDYLLSDEVRPMKRVFYCRKNPSKDFSNGLVGQAWVIEALVELYNVTDKRDYIDLAVDVFLMHPYDEKYRAWQSLNVDGSHNGFDSTFNHQLWFAAAGGMLSGHDEIIKMQVTSFLDYLHEHLSIYRDGCIKHAGNFLRETVKENVFYFLNMISEKKRRKQYMRIKSIGYHGFNLYAFALLKTIFPDHSFWNSNKFKKTLRFAKSDKFKKKLPESKFGFPYNPLGFEVPYAFQVFDTVTKKEIEWWVSWQIKKCYNFETHLMTKGDTQDKKTSAARIYEATRLNNYKLDIS